MFNDPNVVMNKPEMCRLLMSKVLYLLVVEGETLTNNEVTDVFFGCDEALPEPGRCAFPPLSFHSPLFAA